MSASYNKFVNNGNKVDEISQKIKEAEKQIRNPFPIEVLPSSLVWIITEFCKTYQYPNDFLATAILNVCGTVIGNTHKVVTEAERTPLAPNFYTAIIGNSSAGKSPCIDFATEPLKQIDIHYHTIYKNEKAIYDEAVQQSKQTKESTYIPDKPQEKHFILTDLTIEAMYKSLENNPRGLLVKKEELIGWINSMNQYKKGSEEQTWIELYDNGFLKSIRTSKETIYVPHAFTSVLGGIQPALLKDLAKDYRSVSGFMQRIVFAFPQKNKLREKIDDSNKLDVAVKIAYKEMIQKLHDYLNFSADATEPNQSKVLHFSIEAQAQYLDWYGNNNKLINELNENEEEMLASAYGKMAIFVAKFALILELVKWIDSKGRNDVITLDSLKSAIAITEYYRINAKKVYEMLNQDKEKSEKFQVFNLKKQGFTQQQIAEAVGINQSKVCRILKTK